MFSEKIVNNLSNSSFIRKMFDEGDRLKKIYGSDNVFDFSIGNPDAEPPKLVKESLKAVAENNAAGLHKYMSNAGYESTRKAVADMVSQDNNVKMPFSNIVMTCGAAGGLNVVLKSLLNPDDEVIVFSPYFVEYLFYIDNCNGKAVIIDTDRKTFLPDPEAFKKAVNGKTKAVIINSPNNPTGVVYNKDCLVKLNSIIEEKQNKFGTDIYLISDEPYTKIVYDNIKVPGIFDIFDNAVSVNSFSKSLALPGERIGFIAVSPKMKNADTLISALLFCNRTLGFVNAPAIAQRLIEKSLTTSIDINYYKKRRDFLYENLTRLGFECIKPQGAFYLFMKSPVEDEMEFVKEAVKYNILIVPGTGFGCKGYVRIAYCIDMDTIKNSIPSFEKLSLQFNLLKQ